MKKSVPQHLMEMEIEIVNKALKAKESILFDFSAIYGVLIALNQKLYCITSTHHCLWKLFRDGIFCVSCTLTLSTVMRKQISKNHVKHTVKEIQ